MKERPILFSAPMVRALLDGTKTQTRRIVNADTLKAKARVTFRSDMPGESIGAATGQHYQAQIAMGGAVSVLVDGARDSSVGEWLGAKPGEFDFVCPYAEGRTYLDKIPGHPRGGDWRIDVVGSRLWVKETWQALWGVKDFESGYVEDYTFPKKIPKSNEGRWSAAYAADWPNDESVEDRGFPWRPSIFMPRWASRITLEVTGVRVERLQDISEDDARAEGAPSIFVMDVADFVHNRPTPPSTHRNGYERLWGDINGRESWDANPWVWVVDFRRVGESPTGREGGQ